MPELPEVETTLRGIAPHIKNQLIESVAIRQHQLRWRIPFDLPDQLHDKKVIAIERRGKYLLFKIGTAGTLIMHLGMSGSLRILTKQTMPQKHDHVDILFANKIILRFTDPRRFGAILWTRREPDAHPLLMQLGLEPLARTFTGKYLCQQAQNRKVAVKSFIMNHKIVVGIGNIYATEALFLAGIHPATSVQTLSQARLTELVRAIKYILREAIKQGGTTLKDFVKSDGKPGYFIHKLKAYGREGRPCVKCHSLLESLRIGQRNTVYCKICQGR